MTTEGHNEGSFEMIPITTDLLFKGLDSVWCARTPIGPFVLTEASVSNLLFIGQLPRNATPLSSWSAYRLSCGQCSHFGAFVREDGTISIGDGPEPLEEQHSGHFGQVDIPY